MNILVGALVGVFLMLIFTRVKPLAPLIGPGESPVVHHCTEGKLEAEVRKLQSEISEIETHRENLRKLLREQNIADLLLSSTRIIEEIKAGRSPSEDLISSQTAAIARQAHLAQMQAQSRPPFAQQYGGALGSILYGTGIF